MATNVELDPKLMREEAPKYDNKGGNCEMRKARWIKHLSTDKGKIDENLAEAFLGDSYDEDTSKNDGGGSALCGKSPYGGAINAKVMTAASVARMQFWARMGVSDGSDLIADPNGDLSKMSKGMFHTMRGNPWVLVSGK